MVALDAPPSYIDIIVPDAPQSYKTDVPDTPSSYIDKDIPYTPPSTKI
jgi:hypothetical protein